jgi:GNAT superfamily N-acetyltransferase
METLARHSLANVAVWRADAQARPQGAWAKLDGLALHSTGIPERHWNGAILTSYSGLAQLAEAGEWFAQRHLPWGLLIPSDFDGVPPGLLHVVDQPVMLRELTDLAPVPSMELRWDAGEDASLVQAGAFGVDAHLAREFVLPKLQSPVGAVVVGYDAGLPVTTATLFAVDGVAAVYGVGTSESHRRKGLGAAITLAVLHEAVRRGCDLAFLNPSDSGYGVYRRLGFRDAAPNRIYRLR